MFIEFTVDGAVVRFLVVEALTLVLWHSSGLFHKYETVDGTHSASSAIDQEKLALYGVVEVKGSN